MIRKDQFVWSRLKVGLLFLCAVGLLVVVSLSIEGSTSLFQTSYRANFDDIVGLKIGAPVRIAGLNVGHVDDVRLLDDALIVEVTFSVENDIIDRLRSDASAVVRAMSVLGDKILVILPGTPSQPQLQPNTILPGQVELEIAGIVPSAESTILNLNQTLLEVRNLVASIQKGEGTLGSLIAKDDIYVEMQQAIQNVDGITEDIASLTATIKRGDGTVGQLLASGEFYDRIMTVTERMNRLLIRFNQPNGTLARIATDGGSLYRRLDTIATHGERIGARLNRGEGTAGRLLVDEEVYGRIDKVLSEMERLVTDIQENPTRYFKFSVF
ncbi:MAG: hypothetical protein CMH81_06490 [Nitrospiraceae bacterium]|nr:hypothetical protein [Nitrospiraceae bacterium]